MPEKFKKSFVKKLDKTAAAVERRARHLTPSLKVRWMYLLFKRLHLKGKMWEIDNEYWREEWG